ncbi:MAG: xanthine dehydrogenase family protein [Spirochaetaceae bacterium]|nr:xanthine dehydrogenase family protein [Spirochaetaceae bacterium]
MPENDVKPKRTTRKRSHSKKQFDYTDVYSSDIILDDMLFGVLVRSPVQCGAMPEIELPELPEGVAFFSAKDIPGTNNVAVKKTRTSIFADKEILYYGQPIGILVGPDENKLNELLPSIGFSLDPLNIPSGLEFSDSFSADQLLANRSIHYGEPDSVFAESKNQFEQTYKSDIKLPKEERNSCVVSFTGKQLHVYTNSQWASHLRKTVADTLNINDEHILIHKTHQVRTRINDTWISSVTAAQAAVAAYNIHKPIKIVYSLSEQETYIERMEPASIRYRTSCSDDGIITSMDICILINAGIINPFIQYILDRFVIAATGVYKIQNLRIDAYAIKSNYPPLNCSFTWGDSQAFFAIENHIHYIAQKLNIDIEELKQKNRLKENDSSFYCLYKPLFIEETINKAYSMSDYKRRNTAYQLLSSFPPETPQKRLRGIGLAVAQEGNCLLSDDMIRSKYSLETTLETDGSLSVKIYSPTEHLKVIWQKLIEKILEIPPENVHFDTDYSNTEEPAEPDVLSLNITIMTQLLKKCCTTLQKSRFRQPLPICVKKSFMPAKKSIWNDTNFSGQPFQATSCVAAVVEVEVDTISYEVTLRDVNIALECGELLDEKSAVSSVKTEASRIIRNLVAPNSLNLVYPKVEFVPSGEPPKEIGSIIENVLPAAFSSAVSQALGIEVTELPLETDSIYKLMSQKGAESEN